MADSESRVGRATGGRAHHLFFFRSGEKTHLAVSSPRTREREREPFARFYDSLAELSDFDPLLVAKRQLGFLAVTKEAILQTTN